MPFFVCISFLLLPPFLAPPPSSLLCIKDFAKRFVLNLFCKKQKEERMSSNSSSYATNSTDLSNGNEKKQVSPSVSEPEMKEPDKLVKLQSQEEQEFLVAKKIICKSVMIKTMLEDLGDLEAAIPLPNVSSVILQKVIDYLTWHYENPAPPSQEEKKEERRLDDIIPWDQAFVDGCKTPVAEQVQDFKNVWHRQLFDVILAANYMDIKPLLDLGCKSVAIMIKGKNADEIRKTFNIKNEFTPEEEEQIRKENEWTEEKENEATA